MPRIQILYMTPTDDEEQGVFAGIEDGPGHRYTAGRPETEAVLVEYVKTGVWAEAEADAAPEWIPGHWITRIVFPDERYPKESTIRKRQR